MTKLSSVAASTISRGYVRVVSASPEWPYSVRGINSLLVADVV
ncbi:MAG TPA: hypothetical protein VGN95_25875 [Pyrinomonadaceae bacterium]|nr:hypothetical protein [Pyrinomonadaceae bacterium]